MVRTVLSFILGLALSLIAVSPAVAKAPEAAQSPAVKNQAPAAKPEGNMITIIGEPETPAPKSAPKSQPVDDDEELLDSLFNPPEPKAVKTLPAETTLTPAGTPPVTSVPAGPGEARAEKSAPAQPKRRAAQAPDRPARRQIKAAATRADYAPAGLDLSDPDNRRYVLAMRNWQRVGAIGFRQPGGLFQAGRVVPIDQAVIPSAGLRPWR
ncbi:MAG: hypothetical protein LBP55_04115 [Candidatus Adiutrix sp.]|jgi:hypothetical protein|nr:hypothetical protein [Candidatus Adiutrix sp.]